MNEQDSLHRFLFDGSDVRGEWVHLDESWKSLMNNADYPEPVRKVLGEALAAVALLAATMKFGGSLSMQISGAGYVNMLVVQATGERTIRGVVHWDKEAESVPDNVFGEDARLVMMLDPGEGKERYQGMVVMEGDSVASALEDYFERSEQLATRIWLTADDSSAAGMLLQRMPESAMGDDEAWARLCMLTDTVTNEELLSLDCNEMLYRLYHEETVRIFEQELLSYQCRCSRDSVGNVIVGLGEEEADSIIKDEGAIDVQCEFCNSKYVFDSVDVEGLFRGATGVDISTRKQ